jgi:hypothetical protein
MWDVIEGENSTPPVIPTLRPTESREGGRDAEEKPMPKVFFSGNEAEVKAATESAGPWRKKNSAALDEIIAVVPSILLHLGGDVLRPDKLGSPSGHRFNAPAPHECY